MPLARKRYDADIKAKIALEALRGDRTLAQIASSHGVHPAQVTLWKKQLEDAAVDLFADKRLKENAAATEHEALQEKLYRQIGELTMEVDWLKKKSR